MHVRSMGYVLAGVGLVALGCSSDAADSLEGSTGKADTLSECEEVHAGCDPAEEDACWYFSEAEGLAFSGFYLPECDELETDCGDGLQCSYDFACGLDAPCPGICVTDACLAAPATTACQDAHTACAPGDANCWAFSEAEGLSFSGHFVPECDEVDTSCAADETCAFNSACGLDDFCPGLCVSDTCMGDAS